MLNAARGLALSVQSAPELPHVDWLEDLYRLGVKPRQGELIMVAGRSGTQKSGFAMAWTVAMNLPTLYLSGDMSLYQASVRLACSVMGLSTEEIEHRMAAGGRERQEVNDALAGLNVTIAAGAIRWDNVDAEIASFVELHNEYPKVIVFDNLMDIEGAEADYQAQMEAMQTLSSLKQELGATVIVLHHASDKTWEAKSDPWAPPSRDQVKGGLAEKPELSLTVALDPTQNLYRIACVKQRMGPCDPTARTTARLLCVPSQTRFEKWVEPETRSLPSAFVVG